jgi:hypothetical protein
MGSGIESDPMSGTVQDALDAGRDAMRRHDWEEGRRLRQLGKAKYWCADPAGCLDAFERVTGISKRLEVVRIDWKA